MNKARQLRATTLQGLVYALLIPGNLIVIALAVEQPIDAAYRLIIMMTAFIGYSVFRHYDMATPWNVGRPGSIGTRVFTAWTGVVLLLLLVGYITQYSAYFTRTVLLLWFMTTPVLLLLMHWLVMFVIRRLVPNASHRRSAIIIFANDTSRALARTMRQSTLYELVGYFDDRDGNGNGTDGIADLPFLGRASEAAKCVLDHRIEVVFVAMPDEGSKRAIGVLDEFGDTTASVYYVPDFLIFGLLDAQVREVEGMPMLEISETPFYGVDGALKRAFDIGFSLMMLSLLSPLLLLVGVLVKLTSPGPVFFLQKRYGLNGQRFAVFKFRSMYVGDETERQVVQATRDDPRVTPLGRFIRRTSIDELPQFINVLRGEMSVVGPRPHSVAHNEHYRKAVKRYMVRHKVRPGVTGWAQVRGLRGEIAQLEHMEERIKYDLEYIRQWSPWMDLKIIAMTASVVFRDKNAF